MPRRNALHHHRPAVDPARRRFLATISTTNGLYRRMLIGAARRKLSQKHGEWFWRRATLVSHARSGSAATAIRCSPREPTFGTRATMGCGGLEKSVRVRRRMGYTWSGFLTIQGRPSSLFYRRATRPQRGRARCWMPTGSRSQGVLSGGPTKCRWF